MFNQKKNLKEDKKIKDFCIALYCSKSCEGEIYEV